MATRLRNAQLLAVYRHLWRIRLHLALQQLKAQWQVRLRHDQRLDRTSRHQYLAPQQHARQSLVRQLRLKQQRLASLLGVRHPHGFATTNPLLLAPYDQSHNLHPSSLLHLSEISSPRKNKLTKTLTLLEKL